MARAALKARASAGPSRRNTCHRSSVACSVTRSPNLPVWVSFSVTTRLVQNNCSHVRFSVKITCDPVSHHTPAAVADFVSVCPAHRHAELTPLPLSAHRVAFPAPGRKTNQPFSDLASSTVLRLHVPAGSRSIASHPPLPARSTVCFKNAQLSPSPCPLRQLTYSGVSLY